MGFYNPNVAGEMAQLTLETPEKYVPKAELDEDLHVTPIPLVGDQLFEERARNVKWTYQNGDNDDECINGLRAEFVKVTLYEVCINCHLKRFLYTVHSHKCPGPQYYILVDFNTANNYRLVGMKRNIFALSFIQRLRTRISFFSCWN